MEAQTASEAGRRPSRKALRDSVQIRLALNSIGPTIAEILKENGVVLEHADWGDIEPYWLIACVGPEVIGCCTVMMGKPAGVIEFLYFRPSVPFKLRAVALRKIVAQAAATVALSDAAYMGGFIATANKKFADVVEDAGCIRAYNGALYLKRLTG